MSSPDSSPVSAAYQARLRALSVRLSDVRETERQLLSRALHDQVSHELGLARLKLSEVLRSGNYELDPDLQEKLREVEGYLKQAVRETRRIGYEYCPQVLYDGGLLPALQWLADYYGEKHGIRIETHHNAAAERGRVSDDLRPRLFTAMRECLFNAYKYAKADRILLSMEAGADRSLLLEVRDDGLGFDVQVLELMDRSSGGLGLFSIQEMTEHLGGTFECISSPGKGTCIRMRFPPESNTLEGIFMTPNPIRIVLAEDHAMMRDGLRSLIRKEENMRIVGEAETGEQAVEYARKLGPHVMILDIGLPDLNGIDATRMILRDHPHMRIIGLSMHADRSLVGEMLKAGACGYVPKDCAYEELVEAVKQAVEGNTYLSPEVTRGLVDSYVRNPPASGEDSAFTTLSERQRQVLQLLAEGSSTKEIAAALGVSVRTAETHRRNIMEKLDKHSVAELTKYAIRTGLTTLE